MASSEETCEENPDFAVICSFITKFGSECGVNISIPYLKQLLEDTKNVSDDLTELLIHLLRRGRKRVTKERWEKSLIKFCHEYSSVDAWELERFGYLKSKLSVKLELLKRLLELQFDSNAKFKSEVNKIDSESLRIPPIGRDIEGHMYWYQLDKDYNMRLYRQGVGEESDWNLLCSSTEELRKLLGTLEKSSGVTKEEIPAAELKVSLEDCVKSKTESDGEDLKACLSQTKPCTIIIKTERKDSNLDSQTPDLAKLLKDPECTITVAEKSKTEVKQLDESSIKTEDNQTDCIKVAVKTESLSKDEVKDVPMEVDDCKIEKEVPTTKSKEMPIYDIEMTDIEVTKCENIPKIEAVENKSAKSSGEKASLDKSSTTSSVATPKESTRAKSPNKVILPVQTNIKGEISPSKPFPPTTDLITEPNFKGGKIKLYERWSNEKRQNAPVSTGHESQIVCNLSKNNQKSNVPVLIAEDLSVDSRKSTSVYSPPKTVTLPCPPKEQACLRDEVPMDLSVPHRSTNVTPKSASESSPSDFRTDFNNVSNLSKSSVEYNGGKDRPSHLASSKNYKSVDTDFKSVSEAPRPLKKKHTSMMKDELANQNSEHFRKSVIFEVKNSKLNQYPENQKGNDSVIVNKVSTESSFSHLQALQNMCDTSMMLNVQNSVIHPLNSDKRLNSNSVSSKTSLNLSDKSYNDNCDSLSKIYNFSSAQASDVGKLSTESSTPSVLLKSNVSHSSKCHSDVIEKDIKSDFSDTTSKTKLNYSNKIGEEIASIHKHSKLLEPKSKDSLRELESSVKDRIDISSNVSCDKDRKQKSSTEKLKSGLQIQSKPKDCLVPDHSEGKDYSVKTMKDMASSVQEKVEAKVIDNEKSSKIQSDSEIEKTNNKSIEENLASDETSKQLEAKILKSSLEKKVSSEKDISQTSDTKVPQLDKDQKADINVPKLTDTEQKTAGVTVPKFADKEQKGLNMDSTEPSDKIDSKSSGTKDLSYPGKEISKKSQDMVSLNLTKDTEFSDKKLVSEISHTETPELSENKKMPEISHNADSPKISACKKVPEVLSKSEISKAPENLAASKVFHSIESLKVSESKTVPEVSQDIDTTKISESKITSEIPQLVKISEVAKSKNFPEVLQNTETPKVAEKEKVSEVSQSTETPKVAEKEKVSEISQSAETVKASESNKVPEVSADEAVKIAITKKHTSTNKEEMIKTSIIEEKTKDKIHKPNSSEIYSDSSEKGIIKSKKEIEPDSSLSSSKDISCDGEKVLSDNKTLSIEKTASCVSDVGKKEETIEKLDTNLNSTLSMCNKKKETCEVVSLGVDKEDFESKEMAKADQPSPLETIIPVEVPNLIQEESAIVPNSIDKNSTTKPVNKSEENLDNTALDEEKMPDLAMEIEPYKSSSSETISQVENSKLHTKSKTQKIESQIPVLELSEKSEIKTNVSHVGQNEKGLVPNAENECAEESNSTQSSVSVKSHQNIEVSDHNENSGAANVEIETKNFNQTEKIEANKSIKEMTGNKIVEDQKNKSDNKCKEIEMSDEQLPPKTSTKMLEKVKSAETKNKVSISKEIDIEESVASDSTKKTPLISDVTSDKNDSSIKEKSESATIANNNEKSAVQKDAALKDNCEKESIKKKSEAPMSESLQEETTKLSPKVSIECMDTSESNLQIEKLTSKLPDSKIGSNMSDDRNLTNADNVPSNEKEEIEDSKQAVPEVKPKPTKARSRKKRIFTPRRRRASAKKTSNETSSGNTEANAKVVDDPKTKSPSKSEENKETLDEESDENVSESELKLITLIKRKSGKTADDNEVKSKLEVNTESKTFSSHDLHYLMHTTCLETKFRRLFDKLPIAFSPSKEKQTVKQNLITTFSLDTTEDVQIIEEKVTPSPLKKKKGRLRAPPAAKVAPPKVPESKKLPAPKTPPRPAPRKRSGRNTEKALTETENDAFTIPEGFLEILSNTQTDNQSVSSKPAKSLRGRSKKEEIVTQSQQSSDGESTPIKRSRRIQAQHQKKISELAVEMGREQRLLEQLAKKSTAKKITPQKTTPVKVPEVKSPRGARARFKPPVSEEDTCMESKRSTRKMNSRSRNITKMTLMYEDESKSSEFSTSRETEKSKKRRRGRGSKRGPGHKPWDVSSESSSTIEELTEEEEEEEHEEPLVFEVNEDEFACEEIDESAEPVVVRRARTAKKATEDTTMEETVINDDKPCIKCGKFDRPEWILLCDKCDNGYHTSCLIPPLLIVPDGDWFCQLCEHMFLCECLQKELHKLELVLKQREREELRKQRLAYVGISLDNVLKPEKKEKSEESSKEEEEEDEEEEVESRGGKSKDSFENDRHKKLYGKRSVRARRNVNYQFKEYDELIASAIQEEMIDVGVPLEEEFKDSTRDDDDEADSEKSFKASVRPQRKRKSRKLNDLNFSDDEDCDSGEEYKGLSTDSEHTPPPSTNESEVESAASGEWRIVKTKGKKPKRRARRGRRGRDDSSEDWDEDNESDSNRPVTRRAAQKAVVSYRELSSDDEEWNAPKPRAIKRKKASTSDDSEMSFRRKPAKRKSRVRKWASSESSSESENMSFKGSDTSQESENEWKIKKSYEGNRIKININKKVLSSEGESSSQESAPKKRPNKAESEEESEEEEEEDEEDEEEEGEEDEEEESSSGEEESEEEPAKSKIVEQAKPLQNKEPHKPEMKVELDAQKTVAKVTNTSESSANSNKDKAVQINTTVRDKLPMRTVKKDATKMVPCVIPYVKSPKSGHTAKSDEESDKEVPKEKVLPRLPFPKHPQTQVLTSGPNAAAASRNQPPPERPFVSTIMEPFSNMDEESEDSVPLERIPTSVPPSLPNKPKGFEQEYTPAKELSSFSYTTPEEKGFPPSYSSLAPFSDFSSRPSPLKPSLVETYSNNSSPSKLTPLDNSTKLTPLDNPSKLMPLDNPSKLIPLDNPSKLMPLDNSSKLMPLDNPSKFTPLDSYSRSNSPKVFASLDYSEVRKKKHFFGGSAIDPEGMTRPAHPPAGGYQGEIRFPPEPYPCPQSPNTYTQRSSPHVQRDPGTPPRLYSQYPDSYAPPRSPEYYQSHQYYGGEERMPRPNYQPNYVPPEQGPPFVTNPYVATPVPQPNGGFMIDTLLQARNPEEMGDELNGVTDIVSYITQEK